MSSKNVKREKHLYYLDELSDYKIASGYPDIRGWPVKDMDNRIVGKVDNLLVSKQMERVVYLDVEVDQSIIDARHDPYGQPADPQVREFINKEGENHLIIPVGLVSLDEKTKEVFSSRISHRTFAETKRISRGAHLERDYEMAVLRSYGRNRPAPGEEDHINQRRAEEYAEDSVPNRWDEEVVIEDENYDRELRKRKPLVDDEFFYDREEFDGANFRLRE